ncbi:MAG: hypothetical protein H0U46_05265 [Actinobacteria bacterium]|nr:hypothetical protein [Actinomycetota bacterium]
MVRRVTRRVRVGVTRVGVVACVGVACLVGAGRLDDTVAVFDFRADANAAASFRERTYPESPWVAGSPAVIDDARLWMPEDAEYRVVEGRELTIAQSSGYGRHFLLTLLLPRTRTESESAPWVFCYACTPRTLGSEYEVLSDSGVGFLFARRRS